MNPIKIKVPKVKKKFKETEEERKEGRAGTGS